MILFVQFASNDRPITLFGFRLFSVTKADSHVLSFLFNWFNSAMSIIYVEILFAADIVYKNIIEQ